MTFNLLALLDKLEKFEVVQDGDLVLKFDPNEARSSASTRCRWRTRRSKKLSANYQFTPKGPILIEVFPNHDDFAVRNLGLPGLDRRARRLLRPRSEHGFAKGQAAGHVFLAGDALARTRARRHAADVESARAALADGRDFGLRGRPREDARGRTEMEVPFAMALERGQVLKLRDLNSGLHQAGHHSAGLLPGLAPRRPHRRNSRRRALCARW